MHQPNPTAALEARIALLEDRIAKMSETLGSNQRSLFILCTMVFDQRGANYSKRVAPPQVLQ